MSTSKKNKGATPRYIPKKPPINEDLKDYLEKHKEDIFYIKKNKKKVMVVLADKRQPEFTGNLKDVKEWLSKLRFVQTDPSHIINKTKLTNLKPVNGKWMALLGDKIMVPVSETHLEELQKILTHIRCKQYLKNLFGRLKPEI